MKPILLTRDTIEVHTPLFFLIPPLNLGVQDPLLLEN